MPAPDTIEMTKMRPQGTKKKILPEQCKDTGLALLLIILLVAWGQRSSVLLAPAVGVLVLAMTAPQLFTPLARLWFALSHGMGKVGSTVLLSLVFFVVVTPVALLRRLLGRDAMGLRQWRGGSQSVFVRRDHTFTAADLEKPF